MANTPEITVSTADGCAVKPKNLPRAKSIKVNGVTITRDAVARETQNHPAQKPVDAWKSAAQALVVRELLLQEARRRGIVAEPIKDGEGRRETEDEAIIRGLVDATVTTPAPDEVACRRAYDANLTRFRSPDIFEVRHILFAAPPNDREARAEARARAIEVIAELQRDEGLFGDLAAVHSACPSRSMGGSLGQISNGQTVPEFEQAIAAAPVGTVSPAPVESRYGIHVVAVDRRLDGSQLPFEVVQPQIADWLVAKSRTIGIRAFIGDLVRMAEIEGLGFELVAA